MEDFLLMDFSMQEGDVYRFDDDEDAQEQPLADTVNYNLAGQKANASYKGIVIQNGKKVIMK
jgi:hypothetical protein